MDTEITYYEIFFTDDSKLIIYVEEKKSLVNFHNMRDYLIQKKQSLLEIKVFILQGYQVRVVEKILNTPNEYLVTNRTFH